MVHLRTLFALAVAAVVPSIRPAMAQTPIAPEGAPAVEAKKDTTLSVSPGSLKRVNVQGTMPNSWFPSTEQDFGQHYSQDTVVGRFPFSNPNETEAACKAAASAAAPRSRSAPTSTATARSPIP